MLKSGCEALKKRKEKRPNRESSWKRSDEDSQDPEVRDGCVVRAM